MAKFETKFNVQDEVFFCSTIDVLNPDDCLEISDLFDNAMALIGSGKISRIEIQSTHDIAYILYGSEKVLHEFEMFKTRKEAYLAIMERAIKMSELALTNAKQILENIESDEKFEAAASEYDAENK